MKYKSLLIWFLVCITLYSCTPELKVYEIEQKINKYNIASYEGNIDYLLKNTPKKAIKTYGKKYSREYLHKLYDKRDYPIYYNDIGDLVVQNRKKCNSYYIYTVDYIVDEFQMTPYLDSTALKFNQTEYGKEHVYFNSNSKILQIRKSKSKILIFDKDKRWKVLDDNIQYLDDNYGTGFSDCIGINSN